MAKAAKFLLLAILAALAVATLVYTVSKTLEPGGAIDFHSYWYSGHFIRQGTDPYRAYLEGLTPDVPVVYLDGKRTDIGPIAQPELANVPANTAPLVLILSGLAFLSWPAAKLVWMLCNLALMFAIPGLVLRLQPGGNNLPRTHRLIIYLAFLGMFGTRNTAGNGQTSLLVFAWMLLALLSGRKSWLSGGIWLGLALSKYSLALPVFVYFLLKREYRLLITALVVQLLGAVLVGMIGQGSPIAVIGEYVEILKVHTGLPGIHLASLFPDSALAGLLASAVMTLAVAVGLFSQLRRQKAGDSALSEKVAALPQDDIQGIVRTKNDAEDAALVQEDIQSTDLLQKDTIDVPGQFADYHILTALTLWTLLVGYHRAYDSLVAIFFFALVIFGLTRADTWQVKSWQRVALAIGSALAYLPLSLPARGITVISGALPDSSLAIWLDFQGGLLTLTLLVLLAAALWLLGRVRWYNGASWS